MAVESASVVISRFVHPSLMVWPGWPLMEALASCVERGLRGGANLAPSLSVTKRDPCARDAL